MHSFVCIIVSEEYSWMKPAWVGRGKNIWSPAKTPSKRREAALAFDMNYKLKKGEVNNDEAMKAIAGERFLVWSQVPFDLVIKVGWWAM